MRGRSDSWSPERHGSGEGRSVSAGQEFMGSNDKTNICFSLACREALLAEMGVAVREDGGTVGVFSPKKVSERLGEQAQGGLGVWMLRKEGWGQEGDKF